MFKLNKKLNVYFIFLLQRRSRNIKYMERYISSHTNDYYELIQMLLCTVFNIDFKIFNFARYDSMA